MSDETDQQDAIDAAWDGRYSFLDKPLPAWSDKRQRAAHRMGMVCPNFTQQDRDMMMEGHDYPAHLDDVAIFFWLLSVKTEAELSDEERKAGAWTVELARATHRTAMQAAIEHAEKNGFCSMNLRRNEDGTFQNPGARNWSEANDVFYSVFNGIEASKFGLKAEKQRGKPDKDSHEKKV